MFFTIPKLGAWDKDVHGTSARHYLFVQVFQGVHAHTGAPQKEEELKDEEDTSKKDTSILSIKLLKKEKGSRRVARALIFYNSVMRGFAT